VRLSFGSTVADIVTLLGSQASQVDVLIGVTVISVSVLIRFPSR
jgi:hypothetical protein